MHDNVRTAGIATLGLLTVGWFAGFLAMMFRPSPNPYGWFGLLGTAIFIGVIFAMLRKESR